MDPVDIEVDREPQGVAPRGRSRSRSPSRTPVPEPTITRDSAARSRSPTPRGNGWDREEGVDVGNHNRERSPPPARSDRRRSPSPARYERRRSPSPARHERRRTPPPPIKSRHAPRPGDVEPTNVLGVFGLSIRTVEADLQYEFDRIAPVEKVVVVYDARTSRSRGFGFVTMSDVQGAKDAIEALNGKDLHGRRIRVDFSVTHKPHQPTPGVYKGDPRPEDRDFGRGPPGGSRGFGGPPPPRDGGYGDRYGGGGGRGGYDRPPPSYRDREPYRRGEGGRRDYGGPDSRDDWRRRSSPPPRRSRRSPSPVGRDGPRGGRYSRSPSPRRGGDRYASSRDDRVPPPSRNRHGSHLDSPPRDNNAEPSRFY